MKSIHSPGNRWVNPKIAIYPNTHYLIAPDRYERAITGIEEELDERVRISGRRDACWRPSASSSVRNSTWR